MKTKVSETEMEFLAALARLRTGAITSPVLLKRFGKGRLKINARTVAAEAKRSHSSLSRTYKHLLPVIQSASLEDSKATTSTSLLSHNSKLKEALREAVQERDLLAAQNVALALHNRELEQQLARLRKKRA